MRHALRNGLIPIITVVGLYFGTLIGNSVLTEIIFNRPGLGKLILGALNARDYTLLQGLMIIFAICVIVVNTADRPRLRLRRSAGEVQIMAGTATITVDAAGRPLARLRQQPPVLGRPRAARR